MKNFINTFWTIILYHQIFIESTWWICIILFRLNPFWDEWRNAYNDHKHMKRIAKEAKQHAIEIELEKANDND